MRKEFCVIAGVILGSLLLIAGLSVLGARSEKPVTDPLATCVQHGGVGMHIHPTLKIFIDGAERKIPANIGVGPACMRPVHTHDESGTLHLEFLVQQDVPLAWFFRVWDQPFSRTQILDRTIGEGDTLRVTVNGQETAELENLVLRDRDEVVIEVKKRE